MKRYILEVKIKGTREWHKIGHWGSEAEAIIAFVLSLDRWDKMSVKRVEGVLVVTGCGVDISSGRKEHYRIRRGTI